MYGNNTIQLKAFSNMVVSSHAPTLTMDDGSQLQEDGDYSDFGHVILSQNKELTKGDLLREKMIQSKIIKAEKLGLRGTDFSNFIEGITSETEAKRASLKNQLPTVKADVNRTVTKPNKPQGTNLLTTLQDMGDKSNKVIADIGKVLNDTSTFLQESNKHSDTANQIALEANRILESKFLAQDLFNKSMVETMTSIAQSLEMIPTLIETIAISGSNMVKAQNVSNAHHFQKNVNDAYSHNFDVNDTKGLRNNLKKVSDNLNSVAKTEIKKENHQRKMGDHAFEEKKIIDEENSSEYLEMAQQFFSDAYELGENFVESSYDQLLDFNILTYLLHNTTEVGKINNA